MTADLFASIPDVRPRREQLAEGAFLLRGFAKTLEEDVIAALREITVQAPFRHMVTPGGHSMSVAMTNCGRTGWVTDRSGYRYDAVDPESGTPWPPMPQEFLTLAENAAGQAGFDGFMPDACLINRYEPGARMSLHQDKDESDFSAPIVSVSLGCLRFFCSAESSAATSRTRYRLEHGDIVVWGGPSRLAFHGVAPLADGEHLVWAGSASTSPFAGRCDAQSLRRTAVSEFRAAASAVILPGEV